MRDMRIVAAVSLGILAVVSAISLHIYGKNNSFSSEKEYEVIQQWKLPKILTEISALDYLDAQRLACVQDEDGSIFIYNLASSELEAEIKFAGQGDYEGLAIHEKNAYVLRSDGLIYFVKGFMEGNQEVKIYQTNLREIDDIDLEGLCVNRTGDGLIIAAKSNSAENENYKIIQELQFQQGELIETNRIHLSMDNPAFDELNGKRKNKFSPSAIKIHPITGEWYLLDGKNPKLLITDSQVNPKRLIHLDKHEFPQPEGLTFRPDGTLFVATEGGDDKGKIVKLSLDYDGGK